jgi:hypothetical protein
VEIEGHPTEDLIEELERRGGIRIQGSSAGPRQDTLRFIAEQMQEVAGLWIFLPNESFMTGFDELPT